MRPLTVEYNNLSRPDGSAVLAQGNTIVQGAVYGPTEVRSNKELENKAYLEVIYYSKAGSCGVSDRSREQLICNTLESVIFGVLYPRTSILVILQEMTDDGSLLSACFNTAMLSLLDSGLSLHCTMTAVSAVVTKEGQIIVDPNAQQEKNSSCQTTFVFDSIERNIISSHSRGSCTRAVLQQCQAQCKEAAVQVFDFYRTSVKRRNIKQVESDD